MTSAESLPLSSANTAFVCSKVVRKPVFTGLYAATCFGDEGRPGWLTWVPSWFYCCGMEAAMFGMDDG